MNQANQKKRIMKRRIVLQLQETLDSIIFPQQEVEGKQTTVSPCFGKFPITCSSTGCTIGYGTGLQQGTSQSRGND